MKAKELAEILLRNPEAEVVHYQYVGGDTPLVPINATVLEEAGTKSEAYDGSWYFIDKKNIVEKDIIILKYDSNIE